MPPIDRDLWQANFRDGHNRQTREAGQLRVDWPWSALIPATSTDKGFRGLFSQLLKDEI